MSYKSPIEDFKYNLAMLNYDEVIAGIEKFKEYDSETLMSVVSEIGRLNEQEVLDSNKIGDREGLKYVTMEQKVLKFIPLKDLKNCMMQ